MTLFVLAYLAGVFTIVTPCIAPILPIVLSRATQSFRQGALPLLLGLALAFAAVASLGALAGGWAVEANRHARTLALAVMVLFGLTLLVPTLAYRLLAPVAALGSGLAAWADKRAQASGRRTALTSALLGVATGLVWAPCAGPVLAVILTGAALRGPSVETSLLLLTYGLGAATSLGVGLLFGRRLAAIVGRNARWDDALRRVAGAAVIAGAAIIATGLDTSVLTRWSAAGTTALEQGLIDGLGSREAAATPLQTAGTQDTPLAGPLRALIGAQWLTQPPLRADELRGKVVLVSFWTYSCINCLRNLPHVRAWAEKYRSHGLVVVGVHTPEFAFEKDPANVRKAIAALGVPYPVALDNEFDIWRTFNNRAWPGLYFVGTDGRVRHRQLGEGDYEQSEQVIQRLLAEAAGAPVDMAVVGAVGEGAQAAPDLRNLGSGETYLGYQQATNFASPGGAKPDIETAYRTDASLALNHWGLTGTWSIGGEFATLGAPSGSIRYRFHARDLHLVMTAPAGAVRFRVTIDGKAPGADHGVDVDADGWGMVRESRLYQLVRQSGPVMDRTFEIEFSSPGVRAYVFTFG